MLFRLGLSAFVLGITVAAQQPVSFPTKDGGVIQAEVYGKGDRGVVLAHGGRFNKESWRPQAQQLATAGFRVVAIDFRGYGKSTGPGQADLFTAPLHRDVLAAVSWLRTNGAKSVALVGGSIGGSASANALAESAPGEIDRLVLLAAWSDTPEKLKASTLYLVARDDADGAGPRLPRIRASYEKTPQPKELIIVDGSAHAQFLFESNQSDRVMKEILRFLAAPAQAQSNAPRPIDSVNSLWTEELTWMEVRDAVKAGKTTILIGTGGVEQNGPYVAGGKHNYVLQTVLPYIARKIGNTLIAPIVKFVPEGTIDPQSGHMRYPGTISLEQSTFEALLTDICRSYKAHGFRDIILVGDSGGNQKGMENVANSLNRKWEKETARVHFLPEYYSEDRWSYSFLKSQGIVQLDRTPPPGEAADRPTDTRNGMHDDIYYEAQIAVQDPLLIRMPQRVKAGLFQLHGVDEAPIAKTIELGKKLAEYRAGITAKAFRNSLDRLRGK